ncbi:type VI secretion system Vgr family protein [Enterobacter mori]|uniref:type VI secretion system Vgr family protein n=1 Tax=Enterobacter mori TaxID=539813 RepID=UPI002B1F9E61|nr:type VI secretion system tip protein TssI/VgrG [Enterobacter mori]MEA5206369.1 type VI secretion system tip protein TssI/VgrG [Enterobacter mori]
MGNISTRLVNAPAALASAQVAGLSGLEGLSQLFCYRVELCHPTGGINLSAMLGKTLAVQITGDGGVGRHFHGSIAECAELGAQGRHFRYQLVLRPALWLLSLNRQCRIFQNKSAIEIIRTVLGNTVSADWQNKANYGPLDYCVQYLESDLDFVCRLMEEQGLHYFFRHSETEHQLVIADSPSAHRPIAGCENMGWSPAGQGGQATLQRWQPHEQWRLDAAVAREFDFTRAMSREAGLQHASIGNGGAWLDYPVRADVQAAAALRREIGQSGASNRVAETHMPAVTAGGIITLSNYVDESECGNYLIVETRPCVYSEYAATGACNHSFTSLLIAQRESAIFRAPRATPRPVIAGSQTALVVGKAGETQWVDRYGRIKVQFHWDSGDNQNEACSCWVRVAQSMAGDRWGTAFLPRVGQEVVVTFLDGDPDRPLVIGCVYNAGMLSPYALPQQAARSGFKSRSLGEAVAFSELRFDDKAGAEQLLLRAGRNKDVWVANDSLESVGNERHMRVKGANFVAIEGDEHRNVRGKSVQKIGTDYSLHIEGKGNCKADGTFALMANKLDLKSRTNLTLEAGVTLTLKAGSSTVVLGPTGVSIDGVLINIKASGLVNINSGSGAKGSSASEPNVSAPEPPREADDGSL